MHFDVLIAGIAFANGTERIITKKIFPKVSVNSTK